MMRRLILILLPALLIIAVVAYVNREPLVLTALAQQGPKQTLEAHQDFISSGMKFYPPENTEPPYPTVLQFHGCAGYRQGFMDQWVSVANAAGFMAVIVDSHAPRGIDRERALDTVCGGKELIGQQRAADVLAAYEIVRRRRDVDPDRIVFAGWSHGAWSVMDLVALDPPNRMPAGLKGGPVAPLNLAGAILIYPYCGLGSWTKAIGWRHPPKTLALIAAADTIVDPTECPRVLSRLQAKGADIDMHIYEGVDHVFDDTTLAPEHQYFYNAEAHSDAITRYTAFLNEIAG